MGQRINIYCDESCHLEHDRIPVMVLGALWCPHEKARGIAESIRGVKTSAHHNPGFEIKWCKVSKSQANFYLSLLNYFFDNDDLHFRALVISDKTKLDHRAFGQSHDTWYYKMYFDMLKVLLDPQDEYRVFLDIKDTRSADKLKKLHDVLCNNVYDFSRSIIQRVQNVHSHEVEQVQLADLLTGAVAYANRGLNTNSAKVALVQQMRDRSGYSLTRTTLLLEKKVNIFVWQPKRIPQ